MATHPKQVWDSATIELLTGRIGIGGLPGRLQAGGRSSLEETSMPKISDQEYLLTEQYQDESNLNARIQLHDRFSTNKYGWHRWVFDQLSLSPEGYILELGCGTGRLWLENLNRVPRGWEITLSDLSPGMLLEAQQNLHDRQRYFEFAVIDAQAIPLEDESFDAVIANHVLYHVPDRTKALLEIRRVLRPGGRFYASTIGQSHLQELHELVSRFDARADPWGGDLSESFCLENGLDQLSEWFSRITLHRYEDALVITEAEPLVAYVLSSAAKSILAGGELEFTKFVEQELALHDTIYVTKDSGMFEAL
jgi:ubiquinone/menaquinone biosynthesis C-methylase UbiE